MATGLYRAEWRGNLNGQFRENVMHFRIDPDPAGNPYDNANALASVLDVTFRPLWLGVNSGSYGLDAIVTRRLGPTGGPYAIIDYSPFVELGTRGSTAVSEQLCPCVTLIPPMGVKSAGRCFLPSVAKADINMNVYLAAYRTAVNSLFNALISGFTVSGSPCKLAIFSRKLNVSHDVISFNLSSALGYQRKRATPVGS